MRIILLLKSAHQGGLADTGLAGQEKNLPVPGLCFCERLVQARESFIATDDRLGARLSGCLGRWDLLFIADRGDELIAPARESGHERGFGGMVAQDLANAEDVFLDDFGVDIRVRP